MYLGIYGAGNLGKELYDIALRVNSYENRWEKIIFIDDFRKVLCVLALGAVHLTAGNLVLQLAAGCLTGSAYYILSNALFRTDEYMELVQMVKGRLG